MACSPRFLSAVFGAGLALVPWLALAQNAAPDSELAAIREQNRLLQQQVQAQQHQIDDLRRRLDDLEPAPASAARAATPTRSIAGAEPENKASRAVPGETRMSSIRGAAYARQSLMTGCSSSAAPTGSAGR